MSNKKDYEHGEIKYDFCITGIARGTFYATPKGARKFLNMVFTSPYEGYVCEVNDENTKSDNGNV